MSAIRVLFSLDVNRRFGSNVFYEPFTTPLTTLIDTLVIEVVIGEQMIIREHGLFMCMCASGIKSRVVICTRHI